MTATVAGNPPGTTAVASAQPAKPQRFLNRGDSFRFVADHDQYDL